MIDLNTRLIDLTVGELIKLLVESYRPQIPTNTYGHKQYVYGLKGIAELFGCSKTSANRLKQSGKIDEAITQVGSLIIVDAEKALELAKVKGKKKVKR